MTVTVIEIAGRWHVVEGTTVLHVAETNALAWRWIDRREDSPVSPSEKVSEWLRDGSGR